MTETTDRTLNVYRYRFEHKITFFRKAPSITGIFVLAVLIGSVFLMLPGNSAVAQSPDAPNRTHIEETEAVDGDHTTEFLDTVYFGDKESEGNRVTVTEAPVIEGGLDTTARAISPGGKVSVQLACDPDEQTFLTARLWADKPGATHVRFNIDGNRIKTNARVQEPALPGRFYYVTVAIPTRYTDGQETVTIDLTAGNGSPDHAYAVYTHTENFYTPPENEVQGAPPEPAEPAEPDFDAMRANLLEVFDNGIKQQMENQRYDDTDSKWHGLVTNEPFKLNATMIAENFMRAYKMEDSTFYRDEEMIQRSLAAFDGYCRAQGRRGVLGLWGPDSGGWLGGPDRTGRGHGLTGYAATNMGRSFVELFPILKESPELLENKIDHNGNGQKTITRREAYTRFWRKLLWENFLPRFGLGEKVSNQDIENNQAILWANDALRFLSPEDAVPHDIVMAIQRKVAGILPVEDQLIDFILELQTRNPGEYGQRRAGDGRFYENKHYHWSATRHFYSYTPKGIGFEFGYATGYSNRQQKFAALANRANDHRIDDRFRRYLHGSAHTIVPGLQQNGARWNFVGAIGERGTGRQFVSVDEHIIGFAHGALDYDSDPARRIVREYLRYADNFEHNRWIQSVGTPRDIREVGEWLELLPRLREEWTDEAPTEYRLPAEREGPYAWADPMSGLVMIRDNGGTHYLERMGTSVRADYDGEKRYHRITDTYRAFGDAKADLCQGSRVETAEIGPFEIAMNRSNTHDVRVKGGPRVHVSSIQAEGVVDVISGDVIDPSQDQILAPGESLILDRRRTTSPTNPSGPVPELTSTKVDEPTRSKHWTWSIPEGPSDAAVHSLPLDASPETAQVASYYEDAATMGTRQFARVAMNKYRPSQVPDKNLINVHTEAGRELAVENVDGCTNRLLVEQAESGVTKLKARAILPTFASYDAWSVNRSGFPSANVRTDDALSMTVKEATEVTADTPLTFTLPLDKPVERIVFVFESSWDRTGLRTVLETADGEVLWREDTPEHVLSWDWSEAPNQTDEVVNLEGLHVEDALKFKVVRQVKSTNRTETYYQPMTAGASMSNPSSPTTVEPGWYRHIRAVRIEYTDGTATYPRK